MDTAVLFYNGTVGRGREMKRRNNQNSDGLEANNWPVSQQERSRNCTAVPSHAAFLILDPLFFQNPHCPIATKAVGRSGSMVERHPWRAAPRDGSSHCRRSYSFSSVGMRAYPCLGWALPMS